MELHGKTSPVPYTALPGSLSHTAPSHPPNPKDAGYLTPGCLATVMPGRGVGVWPEAALTREWRDRGGRVQGDVGFGEGRPRWARFLRQREARALGGRRAATVRAEERVSRSQTASSYDARPRPGYHTPTSAWQSSTPTGRQPSAWPLGPPQWSPSCPPPHISPHFSKAPSAPPPHHTRTFPFCIPATTFLAYTPFSLSLTRHTLVPFKTHSLLPWSTRVFIV